MTVAGLQQARRRRDRLFLGIVQLGQSDVTGSAQSAGDQYGSVQERGRRKTGPRYRELACKRNRPGPFVEDVDQVDPGTIIQTARDENPAILKNGSRVIFPRRGQRGARRLEDVIDGVEDLQAAEDGSVAFASGDQYTPTPEQRGGGAGARGAHRPDRKPGVLLGIVNFSRVGCSACAKPATRDQHAAAIQRKADVTGTRRQHGSNAGEVTSSAERFHAVEDAVGALAAGDQHPPVF